ncbi:MAG: hypothetical protein VB050_03215 [Geobacteraceae bacterium]|nr:hypothetical protein [Geobacteraceae bacterium]
MGYVEDGYVEPGYVGADGSPVYFTLDGDTLSFGTSPLRPERPLSFQQADLLSTGAERIPRNYYIKDDLIPLEWPRMSTWDKDHLLSWWRDVARGMSRVFTYSDVDMVQCQVRFDTPKLPEVTEVCWNTWSVKFQLRVQ